MAMIRNYDVHQTWEDWAVILLGLFILLIPWSGLAVVDNQQTAATNLATINAVAVGVLLILLGAFELARLNRPIEFGILLAGLWLMTSPYVLGFAAAKSLAVWCYGLGAVATGLGLLELWQDWRLTRGQMDRLRQ